MWLPNILRCNQNAVGALYHKKIHNRVQAEFPTDSILLIKLKQKTAHIFGKSLQHFQQIVITVNTPKTNQPMRWAWPSWEIMTCYFRSEIALHVVLKHILGHYAMLHESPAQPVSHLYVEHYYLLRRRCFQSCYKMISKVEGALSRNHLVMVIGVLLWLY